MKRKTSLLLLSLICAMTVDAAYSATATQAWVMTNVGNPLKGNDDKLFANQVLLRDMLNVRDAEGNWVTLDTEAKTAIQAINELKALQTTLQTAIEGKQDAGDYLIAEDLTDLQNAIADLESGMVDSETISQIQNAIDNLGNTYATKADMTAADEALLAKIEAIDVPSLDGYVKAVDLADVATTGSYDDLINKPTIPSAEDFVSTQKFEEVQTALEAAIANRQEKGDYLVANDLTALNNAVSALQSGKADVSSVTDLQNAIDTLGDKYATDEEVSAAIAAVEKLIPTVPTNVSAFTNDAGYLVSGDLADYAKSANVANTYATQAYVGTIPATAEAKDIVGYVQEKTAGIATNENLTELTGRVAANETAIAKKADSETVATDIAAALNDAKAYADTKAYDDTALAGRVTVNEGAISTNAMNIATNAGNITANATAIEELQGKANNLKALAYKDVVASADIEDDAVTVAKIAGEAAATGEMMMMTAGEDGVVKWTSVKIY